MLRQKPACSHHQSYIRQITAIHVVTDQPTPPWPCYKPSLPKTPTTNLSKNSCRLWHRSCLTSRLSEVVRLLTKKLRERRKSIDVWINNRTRVEKTLAPPLLPALIVGLGKACPKSRALIVTKKDTTQKTALSPEKTC